MAYLGKKAYGHGVPFLMHSTPCMWNTPSAVARRKGGPAAFIRFFDGDCRKEGFILKNKTGHVTSPCFQATGDLIWFLGR